MRRGAFLVALLMLTGVATGGLAAADAGKTVSTRGGEALKPNTFVRSDLRFSPGKATIKSGETVTWTDADDTHAPHTVTLATADELVQSIQDLFAGTCPSCDAAQGAALAGHFPGGPGGPLVPVLDDGDGEFNAPGDSIFLADGGTASAEISVPAGSTLLYFCAIHPWMQGSISVG